MKAMLTGVFAKAAEAKGKAVRKPAPAAARPTATVSGHEQAVRLSLGPEAAEDATARSSELPSVDFADRLTPAIQALARDLGRLLTAFGMSGEEAAATEHALAVRFGEAERRAALAALDGPAGELRPLAQDARQDIAVELRGIGLELAGGRVAVRLDEAALALARVPVEAAGEGLAAVLGAIRSAIRPGRGLTVETDRVAIDDLGRVMALLEQAMAGPPKGLQGTVILSPQGAAGDGGGLDLSLVLSGRLADAAPAEPAKAKPTAEAAPKPAETRERKYDVRI
ncbi:hypothetical protein [Azospirillum largimobile]